MWHEKERGATERETGGGGRWKNGEREKKTEKSVRAKGSKSQAPAGGNASVAVCGQWQNKMGIYFTIPYVFFCIWKIFSIKSFKKLSSMWGRIWMSFVTSIRQRWPSKKMKICLPHVYYSFYGLPLSTIKKKRYLDLQNSRVGKSTHFQALTLSS